MKNIKVFLVAICAAVVCVSASFAATDGVGAVMSVEGTAYARRDGTDITLASDDRLFRTDTLVTEPDSKLQILLDDGSSITIGPNSSMKMTELFNDENDVKLVSRQEFGNTRATENRRKKRDNYVAIGLRSKPSEPPTDDEGELSDKPKPLENLEETPVKLGAKDAGLSEASGLINESWAIYWYVCGSDLESKEGAATEDILEALEVKLPKNVKCVMQAA